MKYGSTFGLRNCLAMALLAFLYSVSPGSNAFGQDSPFPQATGLKPGPPLTNHEFVAMLYQLPGHPAGRERLIEEIRKRGIAFPVTTGLLSLTATKSGNDTLLRHTLEEADRRRVNPVAASLPPTGEGLELLERTRKATLGAAEKMPDYLVKQMITRSRAFGDTSNWQVADRLSIAVSYRQSLGEQYKLLSVNGQAPNEEEREGSSYGDKLGGTTSSGEYVSMLALLFHPDTHTDFNMVDTDTLRSRRTVVYEYLVKKEFSRQTLKFQENITSPSMETVVGYRGRIWVDRENNRVLRLETISTEIPANFPITAASWLIDYDWVTINAVEHLLPSRAVIELSSHLGSQREQTRNDILFRGYRKFGAEVKIIDIDEKDFPPDKPDMNEQNKPETPPALKPATPKKP